MASNWKFCGVCELRNISKQSAIWCSDCEEGLCDDCREHHDLSKGTRNHETVKIAEYQKLPSNVIQIAQSDSYKKHDQKYQIFCKKHDCPCCQKCVVEDHNKCEDSKDIDDVIGEQKKSIGMAIQKAKTSINNHLNQLHQTLLKDLDTSEVAESKKIRQLLNEVEKHENEIADFQAALANIKQYASDLQTFLTAKEMKRDLAKKEKMFSQ
ncbi:unnamed protein product [Mytilus edulis]|uniref:B box-type domain-containing protein n=1 Tax=Mytilus edulis TaxID=6550 RepID=A0A8S3T3W1_MYTED|nr:unnamed protein product [Mytilus edulis]